MTRGPVAKRSADRTRRNKTNDAGIATKQAPAAHVVKPPAEDRAWHPMAKGWFRSLKTSGQSKFYEDSDWQAARFCAYYFSGQLKAAEDKTNPAPLRAATVAQIWSMMGDLMTTEASRRRVRVELVRASGGAENESGEADVFDLDAAREVYG